MMPDLCRFPASLLRREVRAGTLLWLGVAILALFPAPLMPVARLYHALCVPFPPWLTWAGWSRRCHWGSFSLWSGLSRAPHW